MKTQSAFQTIEGPHCRLREFAERDLAEFARYRAIPEIARYQSWDAFTLEDARRLYTTQQQTRFGAPGSWYQVAIANKSSDGLIGDCGLHFLVDADSLEIGFSLSPDWQGIGIARESVSLLLDRAFGEMNKKQVVAVTDAENHPAQQLLLAVGFHKQGERDVVFKGKPGKEYDFVCLP